MSIYYNIFAPAKLNLNLFVTNKKLNDLHFLKSDICFLKLADKISFKFSNKDAFYQNQNNSFIINNKDNLIISAVKKFRNYTKWDESFEIYLDKKIPIGAGLGGGSADAAATLILLRQLFNKCSNDKKISISKIIEIGYELGSDVPSCIISKDLRLMGYGKEMKRKKFPSGYYFLIIYPNIELSTKSVFKNFDNSKKTKHQSKEMFFENIKIHNSLLFSATNLAPEISNVIVNLKKIPKILAYGMTGSGSTCFGIVKNPNDISDLSNCFDNNFFIWCGKKANYNISRVHCSKMLENNF